MKNEPDKSPEVQRHYRCFFNNNAYRPVEPCADRDELAEEGRRLMFAHGTERMDFFIAPQGVLTSGWVVGVFAR